MGLHIAVDADDVVVDFIGGLLGVIEREYDVKIEKEQITEWNLHNILDDIIGYSFWKHLQKREWLWAQFDTVKGAIGGIEKLRRKGHYMEMVTSKPDWGAHNVWKWLGAWKPDFQRVTIVTVGDNKAEFTEADVLIDDKPENCEHFIDAGRRAILFTQPHNAKYDQVNYVNPKTGIAMVRADNWHAVIQIIEDMEFEGVGR